MDSRTASREAAKDDVRGAANSVLRRCARPDHSMPGIKISEVLGLQAVQSAAPRRGPVEYRAHPPEERADLWSSKLPRAELSSSRGVQ